MVAIHVDGTMDTRRYNAPARAEVAAFMPDGQEPQVRVNCLGLAPPNFSIRLMPSYRWLAVISMCTPVTHARGRGPCSTSTSATLSATHSTSRCCSLEV
jgi:hypothetical protein